MKIIPLISLYLTIAFCLACGDLLDPEIKVHDNYYLLKEEGQSHYSLYYRTNHDDYLKVIRQPIKGYMNLGDSVIVLQTLRDGKIIYEIFTIPLDATAGEIKVRGLNKNDFFKWCAAWKIDHRLMRTVQ